MPEGITTAVETIVLEELMELVSIAQSPPIIWNPDIEHMRNQAESKRGEALEKAREMLTELVIPF